MALEERNFGSDFIRWVKTIYKDISSCIIQNGIVSKFFCLEKGVRQGCPLSALLFIIAMESLACKLRQSKKIKGIRLPNEKYEHCRACVSLFADDITIFTKDKNDIQEVLLILKEFELFSGLRLNVHKTEALWIGSNKANQAKPFGLNWKCGQNELIKSLGVYFSNKKPLSEIEENWIGKIELINKMINSWKNRHLTIVGRIAIVKSLLASQFTYIASIVSLPDNVVNEINTILFKFIWNSNEKVKRKTLIADLQNGGLKMIYFPHFEKSLKVAWIKRILNTDAASWKNIPLLEFQLNDLGLDILRCNCNYKDLNEKCKKQLGNMTQFYHNLIKIWLDMKCVSHDDVTGVSNPGEEMIWNNYCIKLSGNVLYFEDWIKSGIIKCKDLFQDDNMFSPMTTMCKNVKKTGRFPIEYYAVKSAIPRNWKKRIKKNCNITNELGLILNDVFYAMEKCTSSICKKIMNLKIEVKPVCESYWDECFQNESLIWNQIWNNVLSVKEPRLMTLNWKILFRIYPTKKYLKKIGKATHSVCEKCDKLDDLEHFFCNL